MVPPNTVNSAGNHEPLASRYVLQVPGTGQILGDLSSPLAATEYVRSYLQYRRVPLLQLHTMDDAEAYARQVGEEGAEAAVAVKELLGHPLSWSSESEEVIDFRRAMLSLRPTSVAEHAALSVARQLQTYKDPNPPLESLPSTFKVRLHADALGLQPGLPPRATRIRSLPLAHCLSPTLFSERSASTYEARS